MHSDVARDAFHPCRERQQLRHFLFSALALFGLWVMAATEVVPTRVASLTDATVPGHRYPIAVPAANEELMREAQDG